VSDDAVYTYPDTIRSLCCFATVTVCEVEFPSEMPAPGEAEPPYTEQHPYCDECGADLEWGDGEVDGYALPEAIYNFGEPEEWESFAETFRTLKADLDEAYPIAKAVKDLIREATK